MNYVSYGVGRIGAMGVRQDLWDGVRLKSRKLNGIQRVVVRSERRTSVSQLGSEGRETDLCCVGMSKFYELSRIQGVSSVCSPRGASASWPGSEVGVRSSDDRSSGPWAVTVWQCMHQSR
jgi:hypothetical protein